MSERQRLHILYDRYRPEYEKKLHRIHRKIRKLLINSEINFTIKYRLKMFDSYFEKLIRLRNMNEDPIELSDFIGIRIICPFLEDLDEIEGLISGEFNVVEIERKGEKNSFREFSYDSIHLLIDIPRRDIPASMPYVRDVCEIQLRTILQEAWAEVEHELIYKANFSLLNASIKRKLASLNASLTLSDIIFQEIRDYQKEIEGRREKCNERFLEKAIGSDNANGRQYEIREQQTPVEDQTSIKPKSKLEKRLFEALEQHSKKEYKEALETYSEILRMRPKPHVRGIVYNHRGMVYFVRSRYRQSIKDFNRAIKHDPKNVRAYNHRGLAFRMLQEYHHALSDFNQSLNLDPYQAETYHLRALTYVDIHDYSEALENCEKALEVQSDFEPAVHLKNMILDKLGF